MEPRKGFVFYHSWWMAIVNLPREIQGDVLAAIIEYGLTGAVTEPLKPVAGAMLETTRDTSTVSKARAEVSKGADLKRETPKKPRRNPK